MNSADPRWPDEAIPDLTSNLSVFFLDPSNCQSHIRATRLPSAEGSRLSLALAISSAASIVQSREADIPARALFRDFWANKSHRSYQKLAEVEGFDSFERATRKLTFRNVCAGNIEADTMILRQYFLNQFAICYFASKQLYPAGRARVFNINGLHWPG